MKDRTGYLADFFIDSSLIDRPKVVKEASSAGIRLDNYRDFRSDELTPPHYKCLFIIMDFAQGISRYEEMLEENARGFRDDYNMVFMIQDNAALERPYLFIIKPFNFEETSTVYSSYFSVFKECFLRLERFSFQDSKVASLKNQIEFKPEHKHAGIQILNYFQETLNQKYPDNNVTVRIGQNGKIVTMEIETPDGIIDPYEMALEDYGLVVTGKKPVEEYLEDPVAQMGLLNQLNLAQAQLENHRNLLAMKDQVMKVKDQLIASERESKEYFMKELSLVFKTNQKLSKRLVKVALNSKKKDDPYGLIKLMDTVLSVKGPEALELELETIGKENPDLLQWIVTKLNDIGEKTIVTASGKALFEWLNKYFANF